MPAILPAPAQKRRDTNIGALQGKTTTTDPCSRHTRAVAAAANYKRRARSPKCQRRPAQPRFSLKPLSRNNLRR